MLICDAKGKHVISLVKLVSKVIRYLVGHGLEENGGSRYFLLFCVKTMGKVSSIWQIKTHDTS